MARYSKFNSKLHVRMFYRSNSLHGDIVVEPVPEPGKKPSYRATALASIVKALSLLVTFSKNVQRTDNLSLVGLPRTATSGFAGSCRLRMRTFTGNVVLGKDSASGNGLANHTAEHLRLKAFG